MRGWIEHCHELDIRIFLWTLAWNRDEIAKDEAILRDDEVVCGNIANPKYVARFREMKDGVIQQPENTAPLEPASSWRWEYCRDTAASGIPAYK